MTFFFIYAPVATSECFPNISFEQKVEEIRYFYRSVTLVVSNGLLAIICGGIILFTRGMTHYIMQPPYAG